MALTRQQKEEIVASVKDSLKKQKSTVFTDFKGVSVSKMTELKRKLRESGAEYKVIKKNLLQKAVDEAGLEGVSVKEFEGSTGVAFSYEDEVSSAKVVYDFSKQEEVGEFKILGGILENKSMSEAEVLALAKLPSKEQLLGQLVGQLNAPIAGFVNVLAGNIKNLAYVLNAIKEKKA